MTKEELLQRLTYIEWDDFEVKEAQNKMPNNVWGNRLRFQQHLRRMDSVRGKAIE